jgi:hypothetical protein
MLVLPTLKTCNCLLVLLQNADLVLEPLHHFSFFFIVPIFFLGGASKEIINANYFYGGGRRMVRQLQQLRRSEFSLCLPVNDFKGGVGFARARASRLMLVLVAWRSSRS